MEGDPSQWWILKPCSSSQGKGIIITNKLKDTRLEFYPHKINHDGIIIDGHTGNITFEAMRWLSKHNINLTLLNWNGKLLANVMPEQPKSGKLRIKQYQKYLDSECRFEIALKIVQTKVEHSLNLLEELSRFYDSVDIANIRKSIEKEDLQLFGWQFSFYFICQLALNLRILSFGPLAPVATRKEKAGHFHPPARCEQIEKIIDLNRGLEYIVLSSRSNKNDSASKPLRLFFLREV